MGFKKKRRCIRSECRSSRRSDAAVRRIREALGEDVIALFGQGCCGNINGYPLRSTHEKADDAGRKLGNAVLEAVKTSDPIQSESFSVRVR